METHLLAEHDDDRLHQQALELVANAESNLLEHVCALGVPSTPCSTPSRRQPVNKLNTPQRRTSLKKRRLYLNVFF